MSELRLEEEELRSLRRQLERMIRKRTAQLRTITGQLELTVREAREYAENIVETIREPLVVLDSSLRVLSANRAFYDTFKVTPGLTEGRYIYDLGNRQWDIPALRQLLEKILPERTVFNDFEVEHDFTAIGHKIMLLNARQIYRKEMGQPRILLAIEDVTERREAGRTAERIQDELRKRFEEATRELRKALAEAEEGKNILDALMEHVPEGIAIADAPDVAIRRVSTYGLRLTGRHRELLEHIPAEEHSEKWDIYHADGVTPASPEELPLTRATKQGEVVINEEWVLRNPAGVDIPILCNAVPIQDKEGTITGGIIVWRDIRDVKERERVLRESEERLRRSEETLRLAVEVTGLGTFDYYPLTGDLYWSDLAKAHFGLPPDAPVDYEVFLSGIHPEDRERVHDLVQGALHPESGGEYGAEYRTLGIQDGKERWLVARGRAFFNEKGQPVRLIGATVEITERKRLEEEIRHMAHHDALTDLPNRRLFRDIVNIEIAQARRNRKRLAVLFLDLDRFKEVNDTLGHEAGDALLKEVARRLRASIRESDTVARIGGDEFNILLADIARAEDVAGIAQKIMHSFQSPFLVSGYSLPITTSIGVSVYPDDSEEVDTLFRYADIAMYHAKEKGKNTYEFYNPDLNVRSVERVKLGSFLRQAIVRGELSVHYQPQIDLKTRRIVCAEALVRWQHPERGLLPAQQFLPAAEETGFITSIDEWVLRAVGDQVRSWRDAGVSAPCVTVNLSARQFQNPGLVSTISRILEETGMPPNCLDLEITENMAMSTIERSSERLEELAGMGIRISLDDFGTGCSSLRSLKRLPISRLKIDRTFVQDIALDPDDRAIINAVTAMAHTMKMRVVAEGVETDDQLSFLSEASCDEAQGYLFSKPLSAEEFRKLVATGK